MGLVYIETLWAHNRTLRQRVSENMFIGLSTLNRDSGGAALEICAKPGFNSTTYIKVSLQSIQENVMFDCVEGSRHVKQDHGDSFVII